MRLTEEQAELLKNVYCVILSTLSDIDFMAGPGFPQVLTHDNVYEYALGSVFDFAVEQGFLSEPPEGTRTLGGYSVAEEYRTEFLEQVGEFVSWFGVEDELSEDVEAARWFSHVDQETQGDSKWKSETPAIILANFKAATGNVSDISIIERMIPANIFAKVPDIRYSAERKAYYRILREPKLPARLNHHHRTLAEIIRTTVHTPYPDLDPIELTWRLR